jgi:hypothetical protein
MLAAGEYPFIAREPVEPPLAVFPVHVIWPIRH